MVHIIGDDAEVRIDMLIVLAVVFMTGRGDEDRVEVEGLNAQILQVIQLINDALQVTAVEGADVGIGGRGIPVGDVFGMAYGVLVFIVHHIV